MNLGSNLKKGDGKRKEKEKGKVFFGEGSSGE